MAEKLIEKMKYFVGMDEDELENEEYESELEEEQTMQNSKTNKVYNLHKNEQVNVVIFEPKDFEEASTIVDNLKTRKPVVVNLEEVETELAKKFFDFLSGAVYALDGNIQKVSASIFILAPSNVELTGAGTAEDFKSKGPFPWQK
jgi:cell division inhibitor SepF